MTEAPRSFFYRLLRFLVRGPDDPDPDKPATFGETFFPWPLRLLMVAAAFVLGWSWSGTPLGEQLGGGLQYGGLIAISLAASYWWVIFVFNVALALAWWLWPLRAPDEEATLAYVHRALTFVNRQIGHIEVLSVWIVLALVGPGTLPWQLAALAACLVLSEPLINAMALWWMRRRPNSAAAVDLYWARRPLFYAATALGLILIALLAPRQWFKLLPGVIALAVADTVRYLRHVRWSRRMVGGMSVEHVQAMRATHRRWARRGDVLLGPGLVLGFLLVVVGANTFARYRYDAVLTKNLPTRGGPVDYCTIGQPPAPTPDIAMFIVSDSQFHELRGRRFVGQMEFADALVPVALRPVELDVLAAAPLARFGAIYRTLAAERAAERPARSHLWWAHLGDMADLSCKNEMDRASRFLRERYDPSALAGVAPGNHDKAFTGNFFWSPYWDSACPSGRLEKLDSDARLLAAWRSDIEGSRGRMLPVSGWDVMASLTQRGGALVTVTPLGTVRDHDQPRGVIAVFLDTSDGLDFDLGVAGLFGTFSRHQAATLDRAIADLRAAGGAYADPFYVVFMHHPLGEMSPRSDGRLKEWIAHLDGDRGDDQDRARVIGIVSAHTHVVQKHNHCIGGREVPEVVVGSTIDPPQEAALLSLGPNADGTVGLRLQTFPSVARPHKTCSTRAPTIPASTCQQVVAELRDHRECGSLFRLAEANALGRDCSDIENPLGLDGRLQLATRWIGPGDEDEIAADQRRRVRALWRCVCRDQRCAASPAVLDLDDDAYFALVVRELGRSPERAQELTCLGWAAAAVQRYKSAGMTMADALRCGFDDDSLPPSHDYIAPLEVTPCYAD